MNVVFTGTAVDEAGVHVLRDDLQKMAARQGYYMQKAVNAGTDLLVASRTDTVKAKRAKSLGVSVVTYPEFFEFIFRG